MLWCPICQKLEGFTTGSQMLKHFRALINDGVPVDLPLKCNLCQASYQSPKSFTQHITTYHEVPNPSDTQVIPPNNCENCSSNDNIFSQPAYIDTARDISIAVTTWWQGSSKLGFQSRATVAAHFRIGGQTRLSRSDDHFVIVIQSGERRCRRRVEDLVFYDGCYAQDLLPFAVGQVERSVDRRDGQVIGIRHLTRRQMKDSEDPAFGSHFADQIEIADVERSITVASSVFLSGAWCKIWWINWANWRNASA